MAKGRRASTRANYRQRRGRNFVALPFEQTMAISSLANDTVTQTGVATLGEDLYVISIDGQWSLRDLTAGQGPVYVGYNHGDLAAIEVSECLSANVTDPDDIVANERSRRPVRKAGVFHGLNTEEVLNNGAPLRTPIKMSIGDGHTIELFAMNRSNVTITSGTIRCSGTIYGRWQR